MGARPLLLPYLVALLCILGSSMAGKKPVYEDFTQLTCTLSDDDGRLHALNGTDFTTFFVDLVTSGLYPVQKQSRGISINERLVQDWMIRVTKLISPRNFERCLEFGDFLHSLNYTCGQRHKLQLVAKKEFQRFDEATGTVRATPEGLSDLLGEEHYDVIMLPGVIHRLPRPTLAMESLYRATKPNGLLFWTSPFIAPQDKDGGDFMKYTFQGAAHITGKAGFAVLNVVGVGDRNMALADFVGLRDDQIPEEWFNTAKPSKMYVYPLSVCTIARKAPATIPGEAATS